MSRSRVIQEQMTKLLDLLSEDGVLVNGRVTYSASTNKQTFWKHIALQLNAVDGGVYKNTWKWCKMWQDWKNKTKKKANMLLHRKQYSFGQPAPLNSLELRLLKMIDYPLDDKTGILEMGKVNIVQESSSDEMPNFFAQNFDAPASQDCLSSNEEGDNNFDVSGESDSDAEKINNKDKKNKKKKVSLEEYKVRSTLALEKAKVQQRNEELRLRALELKLKSEELKLQENEMIKISNLTNIEEEKLKCFKDISASLKELLERTKNGNVRFHDM